MIRGRRPSSATQTRSVNLYCTQCEAQIGIFDNEWLRLTSSYARSKDKGTHFGTQVGERLQVVPPGAVQKSAVGCQMAEVFCRKCSNMVGQFCKSAPSPVQQDFINQYFYKLSRTFLKDSKTNDRVDPVFAFDTNQDRTETGPRRDSTPLRWQNTPIRESSSTPVTVQTAARSRAPHQNLYNPSVLGQERNASGDAEIAPSLQQPTNLKDSAVSPAEPARRQSTRVVDREGRMFEIEGRLRFHDGRLVDQENFLNDVSARLQEQENVIEDQRINIEDQESQLQHTRDQVASLEHSLDVIRSTVLLARVNGSSAQSFSNDQVDFAGQLELMAQVMRSARKAVEEVELLRAENQELRLRLSASGMESDGVAVLAQDQNMDLSSSCAGQPNILLGKRKRHDRDSEQMRTTPSIQSEQQSTTQTISATANGVELCAHGEVSKDAMAMPDVTNNEPRPPRKATKRGKPRKGSKKQCEEHDVTNSNEMMDQSHNADDSRDSSVRTLNEPHPIHTSGSGHSKAPNNEDDLGVWMDADEDMTFGLPTDAGSSDNHKQQMQFVQDPAAFDDLDFSDEEDEENEGDVYGAGEGEEEQGGDASQTEDTANTDIVRDGRSTAPEPFIKPKPPVNRTRSYITLDRAHIATPWTWWVALANGRQPKLLKPPAIQTRKKDLEDELTALGLQEWIGKDKKSKEYREAVNAARTRLRNEKRAAMLASKGLRPPIVTATSPQHDSENYSVLSTIQNVRAHDPSNTANVQPMPGDENSQSNNASLSKDLGNETLDGSTDSTTSSRLTNGHAVAHADSVPNTNNEIEPEQRTPDDVDQEPPKRKRKLTERAKQQRKSETDHAQQQNVVQRRPRGRPRKSAPAALAATSAEPNATDADRRLDNDHQVRDPVAAKETSQNTGQSSPGALSASKQQILEKMRLKAQQKEQLREEMIMARDKLAEEAMAALEMEDAAA